MRAARAAEHPPGRTLYDRHLSRLVRLHAQIAELQQRPKDDRLAGRLICTLQREESGIRRALRPGAPARPPR